MSVSFGLLPPPHPPLATLCSRVLQILQKLIPMTAQNKKDMDGIIDSMVPTSATNLWGGITAGLGLFEKDDNEKSKNVPAMMVLTDGQPNHM